jgi:uncharacterized protein involved in response to NO
MWSHGELWVKLRWHWQTILQAPHRLAFFLGIFLLVFQSAWWSVVQWHRLGASWGISYAVSPTVIHSTAMTLGFMPLLFAGFLFTAGPKWLGVRPPMIHRFFTPLGLQCAGWLLWTLGGHVHLLVAVAGGMLTWAGLLWVQLMFLHLVLQSPAPDRLHAQLIAAAGFIGVMALGAVVLCLLLGSTGLARPLVLMALWGFVVTTFVTVAHRMLPFFTASALPIQVVWRPVWLLYLLLAVAGVESLIPWLEFLGMGSGGNGDLWMLVRGLFELSVGVALVWLSLSWGLLKSLQIRLLAMLHVGFSWLGLSLLLSGISQCIGSHTGTPYLGLGPLHALTMGFLGSVAFAMVTRVSRGHSGRPLAVDNLTWYAFWLLQGVVMLRIVAHLPGVSSQVLALTATLWTLAMLAWTVPMLGWYGRARADGQPG